MRWKRLMRPVKVVQTTKSMSLTLHSVIYSYSTGLLPSAHHDVRVQPLLEPTEPTILMVILGFSREIFGSGCSGEICRLGSRGCVHHLWSILQQGEQCSEKPSALPPRGPLPETTYLCQLVAGSPWVLVSKEFEGL